MYASEIAPLYQAADKAWMQSLTAALGKRACHRRYDMDQSKHPAECRSLYAKFATLRDAHHKVWREELDAAIAHWRVVEA